MKTVLALILTAASLAAGSFLVGYGYCRWWEVRTCVTIEGFVWRWDNSYTVQRDAYWDRTPKWPVVFEVYPLPGEFADWPQEAVIRLSYYRERLPARSARVGLEGLVDISPAFVVLRMYVDPTAFDVRDRPGMINVPTRYVIEFGDDGYVFAAENEWEAHEMAKAVVWRILQDRLGGDIEKLVGRVPK